MPETTVLTDEDIEELKSEFEDTADVHALIKATEQYVLKKFCSDDVMADTLVAATFEHDGKDTLLIGRDQKTLGQFWARYLGKEAEGASLRVTLLQTPVAQVFLRKNGSVTVTGFDKIIGEG